MVVVTDNYNVTSNCELDPAFDHRISGSRVATVAQPGEL